MSAKTVGILLIVSTAVQLAVGQGVDLGRAPDQQDQGQVDVGTFGQASAIAMDSPVDPEHYFVGPADVFALELWIGRPVNLSLVVSPEGTLIVPTVGTIKISDLSLVDAKKKIKEKILEKYPRVGQLSMTLVVPRSVRVTVKGNVLNPGSYTLQAYHRAADAIELANQVKAPQNGGTNIRLILTTMSRRNVKIIRRDGTISQADLTKFEATKHQHASPYLREGDVVVVPRLDETRDVIGVYGEVNVPGRHEYVPGDSVADAIRLAYGFTSRALTDSIELTRFQEGVQGTQSMILKGEEILSGSQPNIALLPGDRIVVRAKPDQRADYRVTVLGDVKFPGTYPITKEHSRLSEVVRQAGGFLETASIKTAELTRKSVRETDIELERLESARGGVSPDDSLYYYLETDLRIRKENVNVDFEKLFVQGDSTHDVILQDGDIVKVPSRKATIYVFGQVVSPGHIEFVEGEDYSFYINRAGGLTTRARDDDIRIVKAKTRQWLSPDETGVEEGDYVWVPKEIERPFGYYLAIVGQTAAIVSVALSVVILTLQISE